MSSRRDHALCAAALWLIAGCDAVVRGRLSEAQANQMLVALDGAAIAGRKVAEPAGAEHTYRVEVPAGELAAALRVLQQQGLPAAEPPGIDRLLEPSGLVATPDEERARLTAATAGELARSIERFAGVASARVHLDVPAGARPLDAVPPPQRAAVLIVRRAGAPPVDEHAVRALMSAAVTALAPDAVTIVQTGAAASVAAPAATARVGPFSVRRESAPLLRALLVFALLLDVALAAALIWAVRRKRAAQEIASPPP